MFEKSDEQLIAKALQGNKQAWVNLLKRYEKSIYNYGIRMTGKNEDALDLMQEVFISVYRNLATYRHEGSFKSWLFRIAHFRCIEFYRRKRPMEGLDDVPEIESEQIPNEQYIDSVKENKQLIQAMQRLPLAQKTVIELKFFGQFTFDEIAELTGMSANTAKSRMYGALEKLKTLMEVDYA
ncbi:MAG: sigma-70 family RNA polymerase sigma factor [Paraglaciecola sp.]|uniref:RNA polymerase sigma factor n=1 Tax=Pseudomonadati TaxID=3379134 RepID=UPI00273DFCF0|nr:sigma-70 family RNA polymerase sigma factor [Paraglaciecola sp.]MDP5029336.1 sigma-70 family RNA polymerase sigma factor [Paraglaciecola sp.]MDP5041750.1 sigma-70 family RNA polymerase sigma factor [Paraglaciecola sp.]MDP5133451.1 sigma-70 family RNA polymerase sigma factor [Paraglaciecola sp.]